MRGFYSSQPRGQTVSRENNREEPFAREYFRCVTEEGTLIWMYREAMSREWYLHGWWD